MQTEKVDFTGVKMTLLSTLYARAVESRDERPILGDVMSNEIIDKIDFDAKVKRAAGDRYTVAMRAKHLDVWVEEYLGRCPDATVLHLACGLDSRAFRLDVPPSTRWFDVDFPEVIDLRRRVYPDRDGYRMLATSVTADGWLDEVPADGPVLVVAEGLLMYLAEDDVRRLLQRVTERFPEGELMFDVISPWLTKRVKIHQWGLGDPHEIERWLPHAHVELVEEVPVIGSPYVAAIPHSGYRGLFRVMGAIPALRDLMRLERFRF